MDFDRSLEQFDSGIEFTESGLEKAHFYLGRARIHQTRSDYNSAAENHDLALTEIGRKRPRGILAYPVAAFHFLKIAVFPDSWLRTTRPSTHEDLFELSIYCDMIHYLFDRFIPVIEYPASVLRLGVLSYRLENVEFLSGVGLSAGHLGINGFPGLGKRLGMSCLRAGPSHPGVRSQRLTSESGRAVCRWGAATAVKSYAGDFEEADRGRSAARYRDGL